MPIDSFNPHQELIVTFELNLRTEDPIVLCTRPMHALAVQPAI